jgi:recombination protein RecR
MDPIERLSSIFEKFPGIGPRQAHRFVQYLLRNNATRRDIVDALQKLGGSVQQCPSCMRFFGASTSRKNEECGICANKNRDESVLSIVAADADLLALERSGTYRGHYFVLGGTISLASEKMTGLRTKELSQSLERRSAAGLTEVILAFPANPEGDATAIRLREDIKAEFPELSITSLGRGLSTGSELEYADPETIKSALESRR